MRLHACGGSAFTASGATVVKAFRGTCGAITHPAPVTTPSSNGARRTASSTDTAARNSRHDRTGLSSTRTAKYRINAGPTPTLTIWIAKNGGEEFRAGKT